MKKIESTVEVIRGARVFSITLKQHPVAVRAQALRYEVFQGPKRIGYMSQDKATKKVAVTWDEWVTMESHPVLFTHDTQEEGAAELFRRYGEQ